MMIKSSRLALISLSLCVGTALAYPLVAMAQTGLSSQEDLQSSDAGRRLAVAMSALGTSPKDITALIDAGEAALKLDDPQSAIGFFGRADDVSPNNGRVKAGIGRSMLALGQTVDALRLMDQAEVLRYSDGDLLMDRGLARDLTGNQTGAQRDYQEALRLDPKNAIAQRRYAVSLGIAGQLALAEKAIEPLLYKNDRAAWRDRAFILAMNGKTAEAIDITGKTMPPTLATAIKPYIERMAMLTPGQRAAAVHMGQFPAGLVNVRVAANPAPPATVVAAAEPAPKKGRKVKESKLAKAEAATRAAPAAPAAPVSSPPPSSQPVSGRAAPATPVNTAVKVAAVQEPARAVASVAPASATPPVAAADPRVAIAAVPSSAPTSASAAVNPAPSAPVSASASLRPAVEVASTPRPVQGPPAGMVERTTTAPVNSAAATAASTTTIATRTETVTLTEEVPPPPSITVAKPDAPAGPAESTRSLADIMAEITVPEAERQQAVAAVDLTEIAMLQAEKRKQDAARKAAEAKEAAKRKAEAEAKAKADAEKKRLAANPARYWVQIGVGRDKGALAFTLRQMKKDHSALGKYDGWAAEWGRTNRLIVGPFSNLTRAKAVEADLKKDGSDAFVWRSEAGEEVDRVGG